MCEEDVVLFLVLSACHPDIEDTGETGEIGETGDPGTPCTDFTEIIETCEEAVEPIDGEAGDYYAGMDLDGADWVEDLALLIHTEDHVSYDGLWSAFLLTDVREDGTLWDIYSTLPTGEEAYTYQLESDQCGQYSQEGDCYNREHTWPSSWFGGYSPMKSDLHHVFPTDGYVNNKRGSYPFGQVGSPSWTSTNGSMVGRSDQCDASYRVFEPIDAYKGDIARAFFYMAIRYRGEDEDWTSSGATEGTWIEPWAEQVLRAWHILDPPDAKEIDRNNAIAALQGNRNPFIDHPEWVCFLEDF